MDNFVIDTNFFISMDQLSGEKIWLNKLNAIAKDSEIIYHVTGQILGEMPFLQGDMKKTFSNIVNVANVSKDEIDGLKKRLGEKNPAQDNDQSLLYLASTLPKEDTTFLVTDDYKLVENAQKYDNSIKILTPGAFALKLSMYTKDAALKRYFKSMEKKLTDYSINYILSRKDIYPAAKKLSWLIDRTAALVGTSDAGIDASATCEASMDIVKTRTAYITATDLGEDQLALLRVADVYVASNMTLDAALQKSIEPYHEYLDNLKLHVSRLTDMRKHLLDENYKDALDAIKQLDSDLIDDIIKARFEFKDEYPFVYTLTALQIYKIDFFKAYVYLLHGDLSSTFIFLTETAYWASQSHQDAAILNTVYMKAMLFFFNFSNIPDFYIKAIEHFEYARFLAEKVNDIEMQIKCLLAKAIASYEVERFDDAEDFIKMVNEISMSNPESAVNAFAEMADYFLIFGKPEYAVFLFDEALEAAVVAGVEYKCQALLEKMKKSYIIAGARMNQIERGGIKIDSIIDQSFDITDKAKIDEYNDQIMKLAQLNSLSYEPFPFIYNEWTAYGKIDDVLKNDLEVIEIENIGEQKSRVIAYASSLGLVGFNLPVKIELAGPAESYTMKLEKTASIKTRQATGELVEQKLIRALINTKNKNDVSFSRIVPSFLKMAT
ncbi:MAG TPA: hypothetical protein VKM55_21000 [Candidatus Lokiarchaeia archaeon]|nr:hypothetical protein [Candidatus Lokiarchaeia archaeon]